MSRMYSQTWMSATFTSVAQPTVSKRTALAPRLLNRFKSMISAKYKTPTSLVRGWKESLLFSVPPFRLDYVLPCRCLSSENKTERIEIEHIEQLTQGLKEKPKVPQGQFVELPENIQVLNHTSWSDLAFPN